MNHCGVLSLVSDKSLSLDTSRVKMIRLTRFDLFHNIDDERKQTDKGREQ